MDKKDVKDAALALCRWCESQNLRPCEAVPVMMMALVAVINGASESPAAAAWVLGHAADKLAETASALLDTDKE